MKGEYRSFMKLLIRENKNIFFDFQSKAKQRRGNETRIFHSSDVSYACKSELVSINQWR